MLSHISKDFIAELLARVDIVDIVNQRVQLKKAGANFVACCPFHNEKTPSFTVSPTKQFYYCFGCGAHGNAIGFLMQFDRLEFPDAVEYLANQVGMTIPKSATSSTNDKKLQNFYDTLMHVSKYYQQQLRKASYAIEYLKKRGLSGDICKRFNIGFAPSGWNNLLRKFATDADASKNLLATGMLINNGDKTYDRFRDRVMFPIRDVRGRIVGFGGRTLANDKAKYLNSPETAIFHKSNELYGLFEAKQFNNTLPYLLVVEGYMDVIALAQFGINFAVATLGTAVNTKHIQKLMRYTPKIIFCFDGDSAGHTAAWRALENCLPIMRDGVQALFLFLPNDEDPDSQIRKDGLDDFKRRVEDAIPLSDFFFSHLSSNLDLKSLNDRVQLAHNAKAFLDKMPNGVFRQLMLEKLAAMVNMHLEQLANLDHTATNSVAQPQNSLIKTPSLVHTAIQFLLHEPRLASHITEPEKLSTLQLHDIEILMQLIKVCHTQPVSSTGAILEYCPDHAASLAALGSKELLIQNECLEPEFKAIIQRLLDYSREENIQELLRKAASGNISHEERHGLQKLIVDAKMKAQEDK